MNWEEYLRTNYAAGTVREYGRDVDDYLSWLGGEAAALTADYATIMGYLVRLRGRYPNLSTPRRILAAIKVYHGYLLTSGGRRDNPAAQLKLQGGRPRRGCIQLQDLLDEHDLQKLIDAPVAAYGRVAGRGPVLVGLLVHQALCSSESVDLRVTDVDLSAATINIKVNNRRAGRVLSLHGSQVLGLHVYLTQTRPQRLNPDKPTDQLLLTRRGGPEEKQSIGALVKKLSPVIGGKTLTPRLIRQSVIAWKLRRGEGLRQVQVFAGHKSVSTTEEYRETGLGELRQALGRYHPLESNR